jgi:hypothetical protein
MTDQTTELQPLMYHGGQPYSRESAATALAEFDANPELVKSALGGDIATQQLRAAYWSMSRGHQPGAQPSMPHDANGIHEQVAERGAAITEARLDAFGKHVRMTPELRGQFKRRLATAEQHDFAVAERERLLKDPPFRGKVFSNDADSIDRWIKIVQAATAPVAPADYDWSKDTI